MKKQNVNVSVVICAYTEARWLELIAAIESIQQQNFTPREIIVVIDHNPNLFELARTCLPKVVVMENQGSQGASEARNSGAAIAQGEIIAFLDDDAVASPHWIEQLCVGHEDMNVLGVGGEIEPYWLENRPAWFPEEFYWVIGGTYKGMPETIAPVRNLWSGNMSVRRDVFRAIDGFRVGFGKVGTRSSPEDTDFCIRALQYQPQGIWLYNPKASVKHRVPASRANWKYYLWRCYNEGLGKAELSSLVGTKDGLSAERKQVIQALPQGIIQGLMDALWHRDLWGVGRAIAIGVGLVAAIAGYLVGSGAKYLPKPKKLTAVSSLFQN